MPRLVVFDLDGTLTRHDTLPPYVIGLLAQRPWQLLRLLRVVPPVVAFLLGRIGHGELKGRFLHATLAGRSRAELARWTDRYVTHVLARELRPAARAALAAHQAAADLCVLLSASPELYVPAIGERLGFAEVISTELTWQGDTLVGTLASPNRRGTEKTRCLAALTGRHPGLPTVAYGNAASDLDHLRRTDQPLLVAGSWRARRAARRLGVPCASW